MAGKLYVYCPRPSTSAFDLIKALGASRLRKFDGMDFWGKGKRAVLEPNSTIICWGATIPEIDGIRVINSLENSLNKYQEQQAMIDAGVPTVQMVLEKDTGYAAPALRKLGYLPRAFYHQGGVDLLNPTGRADFWVLKENFTQEYRIHSFDSRSIRAGVKVPRDGFTQVSEAEWKPNANLAHPWIRSFDAGWRINYDNFKSTKDQRGIAHLAVKALGLTFGAVDLALSKEGGLKVLEVNTAPGSDPNTTAAYVRAITGLLKEPEGPEGPKEAPQGGQVRVVEPEIDLNKVINDRAARAEAIKKALEGQPKAMYAQPPNYQFYAKGAGQLNQPAVNNQWVVGYGQMQAEPLRKAEPEFIYEPPPLPMPPLFDDDDDDEEDEPYEDEDHGGPF